jgi:hypothetical protein
MEKIIFIKNFLRKAQKKKEIPNQRRSATRSASAPTKKEAFE